MLEGIAELLIFVLDLFLTALEEARKALDTFQKNKNHPNYYGKIIEIEIQKFKSSKKG